MTNTPYLITLFKTTEITLIVIIFLVEIFWMEKTSVAFARFRCNFLNESPQNLHIRKNVIANTFHTVIFTLF